MKVGEKMKGLYIHIPFCQKICSYCDFCKVFYDVNWVNKYLKALESEIENYYLKEEIKTIYIGGGTPSCLNAKQLEILFSLLKKFSLNKMIEFTFECNLNDITPCLLTILKANHVNRLSIGIQRFQSKMLDLMGREHTYSMAKEKITLCREYGFDNINLDFMYALENDDEKKVFADLKLFVKLKPEHISCYSLIINEHTLLAVNKIKPLDEEIEANIYKKIVKYLKRHGYNHYEISNFAKKGYECEHNLIYWHNNEYYGFGLGASGYIDKVRYTNTKNLLSYFQNDYRREELILSKQEIMDNEVMLNLRLIKGLNRKEWLEKYHLPLEEAYPIKPLLKNKELKQKKEYIFIPKDKLYVMNEILLKML